MLARETIGNSDLIDAAFADDKGDERHDTSLPEGGRQKD
jgi:hypothetical protein